MQKRLKIIFIALLCICILPIQAAAIHEHDDDDKLFDPIIIQDGSTLNVFDCVAAAFQNSPKIRRQK